MIQRMWERIPVHHSKISNLKKVMVASTWAHLITSFTPHLLHKEVVELIWHWIPILLISIHYANKHANRDTFMMKWCWHHNITHMPIDWASLLMWSIPVYGTLSSCVSSTTHLCGLLFPHTWALLGPNGWKMLQKKGATIK